MDLVLITDHYDEEMERLTGLGARPLNEIKLLGGPLGRGDLYVVQQTTFADPEGNEFDLVVWQQQAPEEVAASEQLDEAEVWVRGRPVTTLAAGSCRWRSSGLGRALLLASRRLARGPAGQARRA